MIYSTTEHMRRKSQESLRGADRSGLPWEGEEIQYLIDNPTATIADAATHLRRSFWAVSKMRSKLAIDEHAPAPCGPGAGRPRQEFEHGTPSKYRQGCRCGECRTAVAAYQLNLKNKRKAEA